MIGPFDLDEVISNYPGRDLLRDVLLLLQKGMLFLQRCITEVANDGHAIEFTKRRCFVLLQQEHFLALSAPRLKIVWIGTVFYEADTLILGVKHVTTHDGSNSGAMCPALDG
jgi:hypothetical protein